MDFFYIFRFDPEAMVGVQLQWVTAKILQRTSKSYLKFQKIYIFVHFFAIVGMWGNVRKFLFLKAIKTRFWWFFLPISELSDPIIKNIGPRNPKNFSWLQKNSTQKLWCKNLTKIGKNKAVCFETEITSKQTFFLSLPGRKSRFKRPKSAPRPNFSIKKVFLERGGPRLFVYAV